mmetsp:Transcript_9921/g.13614  ORF Transcript_9921/g.13614 Transcript_9921/m.13614 type:complete len:401 (-) Transcript_9921:1282-2484(-)
MNGGTAEPSAPSVTAAAPTVTESTVLNKRISLRRSVATTSIGSILNSNANPNDVLDTESGLQPESESAASDDPNPNLAAVLQQEAQAARLKLPVTSDQLDIAFKDFVALFLQDNAPFSIKRYHESVKDTNLVLSPWAELSPALGLGREMKFFKPVNLPGLASTRGVKVQRMKRFEDSGAIVCSCTRLEDVPAADTFSVDDVMTVKAVGPSSVSVEITFQVTFIKSTMMKYIIEKSTNGEMIKWLEAFFAHLKKVSSQFKEGKLALPESSDSVREGEDLQRSRGASVSTEPLSGSVDLTGPAQDPKKDNSPPDGLSPLQQLLAWAVGFNNQTLGDRVRLVLCGCFCLFLLLSQLRWDRAVARVAALEARTAQLEQLVGSFLAHMEAALQQQQPPVPPPVLL